MPNSKPSAQYLNRGKMWSEKDDALLREKYEDGLDVDEIATLLGRSPASIEMRLNKGQQLGEAYAYIKSKVKFSWSAVVQNPGKEYHFPEPITDFMLAKYRRPVVYRWVAYQNNQSQVIYVGTTQRLCPDRLEAYLNKDPRGANKRLQSDFLRYLQGGFALRLEILSFDQIVITQDDLAIGYIRYFMEKLFINYHQKLGEAILN